jgi:hypothetical protein
MSKQLSSAPDPVAPAPATSKGRAGESPAPVAAPQATSDEATLNADLLEAISELPSLASETPPEPDAVEPEVVATEGPATAEDDAASESITSDSDEPSEPETEPEEDEAARKDWPVKAKRRLSKLVKRVKALESQLEGADQLRVERDRLQAELASAQTPPEPAPAESAPAPEAAQALPPGAITAEEVRRASVIQKLTDAIANIDKHPEGITVDGEELSAEYLTQLREQWVEQRLMERLELRQHRERVAAYGQKLNAEASEQHPWLKNRADPRTQQLEQILVAYPGARNFPGMRKVLADAIAYEALRQAKAKGNGSAPRSVTPPPRQPARPAAAPAETTPAKPNLGAKFKKYEGSGSNADLADLVPDLIETRD